MHDKIWQTNDVIYENGNHTLLSATEPSVTSVPCPWTCELTNDVGYVVYSALGSFYIPMFVMLFFYWRIYMAAIRTTRAIRQGFKTTKGRNCLFAYLFSLSHFTFWIFSSKFLILFSFSKWRLHCLKYSWFFFAIFCDNNFMDILFQMVEIQEHLCYYVCGRGLFQCYLGFF